MANKIINGKQVTILWHVDDLKNAHIDSEVVTSIIERLNNKYGKGAYGKECPLTICRGEIHDYLGMTLDYTIDGKVKIDMSEYISKILKDLPPDFDGTAVTPAANHLFEINENFEKLDPKIAELFHHIVAQLLFLKKYGRPDLLTGVAFLSTRVKNPDEDDLR